MLLVPSWRSAQNDTGPDAPQANCSTASLTTSARMTKPIATRAEWLQWSAIQPCIVGSPERNSLDQDLSLRQRESAGIANGETFGSRNPAGRKASTT